MSVLGLLLTALAVTAWVPATASTSSLGEPRVRGGIAASPVTFGNFVYVPSGISFEIWDVSDAAHPSKLPFEPETRAPGPIFGLAVVGNDLYVGWSSDARSSGGFQIYSLDDPSSPILAGQADTNHSDALIADGDYLYEIDGAFGVTALDASDPLHPFVAGGATGTYFLPQSIESTQVARNQLFVSGSSMIESCWAVIFDLYDPAQPLSVGEIGLGAFGVLGPVSESGYALAFDGLGTIYDVRDPARVQAVGALPDTANGSRGAFRGDDLYLFGGPTVQVWNLSTPAQPAQIGESAIDTSDLKALTPLSNGFLATTITGRGLLIDASVPASPALRSEIVIPSGAPINGTTLDDGHAYVLGDGHALEIIDSTSLETVGVLEASAGDDGYTFNSSTAIGISGTTAIIGGYMTLFAVDVSDTGNPRVVGSLPLAYAGNVIVAGDRAYVPTFDGALTVVDVSDPEALAVRGAVAGLYYTPLVAAGTLVFAFGSELDFSEGVRIIDASDAARPEIIGRYAPCAAGAGTFQALGTGAAGAAMAVACSNGSVEFVDTRNPAAPALAATYLPADASDVTLSIGARGSTFYLGNLHGVDEIDATDPAAPTFVTRHPTASQVGAIDLAPNGSLLAATAGAGMYVFDCEPGAGTRVLPCRDSATASRPPRAHSRHGFGR